MSLNKPRERDSSDDVIRHFLFGGILIINALEEIIFNLIIVPYEKSKKLKQERLILERRKQLLSSKTNDKLRSMLSGQQISTGLNKQELIEAILSNKKSLRLLLQEEKRESLLEKTNQELRALLNAQEKTSRLTKVQLIDLILSQD